VKPAFRHLWSARRSFPASSWGWSSLLLLILVSVARASDLPAAFTLDLPVPVNQALPTWLGEPEIPPTSFATLNLPILTPDPAASLLVTVYFQEKQDGFMRVSWQGTQGAEVLSDNFYENIGMSNQRSLLISPETLVGDGVLTFQCGDSALGIQRIKLEWLESKTGLVSSEVHDLLVTPATGPTQLSLNLNGQVNPTEPGAWQDQLVTVPLTDSPLRIEQGVEFSVDLDKVPGSARLALKEAGLPMGKHLVVWINQERAGTITPVVPDLEDGGFLPGGSTSTDYVGWRDGSFYAPVSLLKEGVNTVQFSDEDDQTEPAGSSEAEPDVPVAVKSMVLQLNYGAAPAQKEVSPPQFSMPASPISSTEIPSTPN